MAGRWERLPRPLRPPATLTGSGMPRLVSPWVAVLFAGASLALVPWVALLSAVLPSRVLAANWRVIWVGFDLMLLVTLGTTAIRIFRRSPKIVLPATAAGTLLVCDAWFDVLAAASGTERVVAVLVAVALELPLAAACFRVAYVVGDLFEQARPHLIAAGFTLKGRRLIPPGRADPAGPLGQPTAD
ncbi:MAG TPA: hypothetical protein VLJ59_09605 [Mycobacteriales bacterium]|nr:hypothetical protein [Mycobacteriales bacterium]